MPGSELTKELKATVHAANSISPQVLAFRHAAYGFDARAQSRQIQAGVSDVAIAWTDGAQVITVDRRFLERCFSTGISGAVTLVLTLVHEYLHDGPSTGTHVHDAEFYERFHQITMFAQYGTVGTVSELMLRNYLAACNKLKVQLSARNIRAMDTLALVGTTESPAPEPQSAQQEPFFGNQPGGVELAA